MNQDRIVFTKGSNLQNLADVIREKIHSQAKMKVSQMSQKVKALTDSFRLNFDIRHTQPTPSQWVRPSAFPDLDSVAIDYDNDEEVVYLSYDNTRRTVAASGAWAGFTFVFTVAGASAKVERGSISNGVFTASHTLHSNVSENANKFYYVYDHYGDEASEYVVYRITCENGHFKLCQFAEIPAATAGTSVNIRAIGNCCVERRGNLPWLTTIASQQSGHHATFRWGTKALRYDATRIAKNSVLNSMFSAWSQCYMLEHIDFTGWAEQTSHWNVTNLSYAWHSCLSLKELSGIADWDVSNWKITTLAYTWYYCDSLVSMDLSKWDVGEWTTFDSLDSTWCICRNLQSTGTANWNTSKWKTRIVYRTWQDNYAMKQFECEGWDTSNWVVRFMQGTWQGCYNLRSLDLSRWDTSGWNLNDQNSFGSVWAYCYNLEHLDVSTWNTSNWNVTTMSQVWAYCYSLRELDLSSWDTSNWHVTNIMNCWINCYSLQTIKGIENWDTSNWAVTAIGATWQNCYMLQELDLHRWNTSKWSLTSIAGTFSNCWSLRSCNLSGWDVTNWTEMTSMTSCFSNCWSLESLDLSTWDVGAWTNKFVGFQSVWNNCYSLKTLNISNWNTTNWKLTSISSTWYYCYSLKSFPASNWVTTNWKLTTLAEAFHNCRSLETIDLHNWDTSNWAVTNITNLFSECFNARSINVGGWDTSKWKLTTMAGLCSNCVNLEEFDISHWDTSSFNLSSGSAVQSVFSGCHKLKTLKFGSFDFSNITNVGGFISGLERLENVDALTNLNVSISFAGSYCLTRESMLNIMRSLKQQDTAGAKTIIWSMPCYNQLSAEDRAVGTSKNWNVAQSLN